jgi:hypothetical protein
VRRARPIVAGVGRAEVELRLPVLAQVARANVGGGAGLLSVRQRRLRWCASLRLLLLRAGERLVGVGGQLLLDLRGLLSAALRLSLGLALRFLARVVRLRCVVGELRLHVLGTRPTRTLQVLPGIADGLRNLLYGACRAARRRTGGRANTARVLLELVLDARLQIALEDRADHLRSP